MAKTKVKICGVTYLKDAVLVASLGADYIGLNFCKASPRKVSVKMAKDILAKMPPFITSVAVFVDEDITEAAKILKKCGFKMIQLHGSESVEYCSNIKAQTNLPVIKAFRIADENSLNEIAAYKDCADYFLLDAHVPGVAGGTGETFNWDFALKAKELGKPVFLAGGLAPDNVLAAIQKVDPFCVDTASGVERLPTKKDYDKMKDFIRKGHGF
ncbi:MAG: phosphoribosylanthranilate isomerase [Elusimicrobia bacterium]|nr:phosphoribosylanthranilate isomerase [Candidatus Liberimonas magnetica]